MEKERLQKQVRLLEYITIGWNTFEGIATIRLGILAASVSLVAFGLSSALEVFAGIVVLWEMRQTDRSKEKTALRLIGTGYFLVAIYTFWNSLSELLHHHQAHASLLGMGFLLATVFVMLTLAYLKKRAGKKIKSSTVLAEANYSLVDGLLAGVVLIGLTLNFLFGLWWTDEVMALAVGIFAVKEGIKEWRG